MLENHFVALLVSSITHAILALFVFSKGRNKLTNVTYALYSSAIAFWAVGQAFAMVVADDALALSLWRLNHYGVIFIPIFFVHFVFSLYPAEEQKKRRFIIYGSYVVGLIFVLVNASNALISQVIPKFYFRHFIEPTHLYYVFFDLWVLWAIYGLLRLFNLLAVSPISKKNQLSYFSISMLVAYFGGVPNFLPTFNMLIPFLVPYGTYAISIYAFFTTYAIIAHNLMEMDVIVKRTAVFAGLFAFVYGVFSTITIIGQELFKGYLGWNQWVSIIPTVLIITFSMRPLENFLTEATERFLFQKKYDYRDLLKTFTNEVLTVLDLQKLTEQTVLGLNKIIKLESASILLLDKDTKTYKLAAGLGIKDKAQVFAENDAIASYLIQTHEPLLRDKSTDEMQGHSNLRDDFKKLNARLCLPIAHHDELTGILSLGMKKSGEEFTPEDVDILTTLAKTLAIAIANAQLFDQLSKTQAEAAQREKMAVIGTLAAGINHEICNPLGIVRGQCEMFLLNLRDGLYNQKNKDDMINIAADIMMKVIKETDRATAITKKLSGFAKPSKKADSEEVYIEKEADEVMGLIGHDLKINNIEFKKDFASSFPPIYADRRQIQEVLFNIIRNAAQAMEKDKKDGWIALSGESQNGMAILKIEDNGSGIPADKIGQIFNPFFTTKEPGKGTGLGLFIVKQVIERNKGTIQVESKEGIGTAFTLTFPVASPAKVLAA